MRSSLRQSYFAAALSLTALVFGCGRVSYPKLPDAGDSDRAIATESGWTDVLDAAGPDGAGLDAAGPDAAGPDAAGPDAAGLDAAGLDAADVGVDAGQDSSRLQDGSLDAALDGSVPLDTLDVSEELEVDVNEVDSSAALDAATPTFAIVSPANNFRTDDPTVIIRGVCDRDVVLAPLPSLTDSDCSDGTWGATLTIDTTLSPTNFSVSVTFAATKPVDGGTAQLSVTFQAFLTEAPLSIDTPTVATRFVSRLGSVMVAGTCAADLIRLTTDVGTFADSDCSDGRWALQVFPMADGQVRTVNVTGERMSSLGNLVAASDTIIVARDTTPPGNPTGTLRTSSGSDENFPRVELMVPAQPFNPPGFVASDLGTCIVATDAACSNIVLAEACLPGALAGGGGLLEPFVRDNATVSLFVQTADYAGNVSACVPVGSFTEATLVTRPSVCDASLAGLVDATTFDATLVDLRNRAAAYRASEGHFTLCLAADTVAALPMLVTLDIPNLYILGATSASGTTCDDDARQGNCAILLAEPGTSLLTSEGNATLENVAIIGTNLQLGLGAGPVMRELKHLAIASPSFAIAGNRASIGRIEDCTFLAGTIPDRGVAILIGGGNVAEMSGVRALGGAVAVLGTGTTFVDIHDSIFAAGSVVFLSEFQAGSLVMRLERSMFEVRAPLGVLVFSEFASNETPPGGFFRSDAVSYAACTRDDGSIGAVRAEIRKTIEPSLVPFTPNTTGFGGALGAGTFPDPTALGPCPPL